MLPKRLYFPLRPVGYGIPLKNIPKINTKILKHTTDKHYIQHVDADLHTGITTNITGIG